MRSFVSSGQHDHDDPVKLNDLSAVVANSGRARLSTMDDIDDDDDDEQAREVPNVAAVVPIVVQSKPRTRTEHAAELKRLQDKLARCAR